MCACGSSVKGCKKCLAAGYDAFFNVLNARFASAEIFGWGRLYTATRDATIRTADAVEWDLLQGGSTNLIFRLYDSNPDSFAPPSTSVLNVGEDSNPNLGTILFGVYNVPGTYPNLTVKNQTRVALTTVAPGSLFIIEIGDEQFPDQPYVIASSGGAPIVLPVPAVEAFTPALGQTDFALTFAPLNAPDGLEVVVNTAVYLQGVNWQFVGPQTVQWLDTPFSLDGTDTVVVRYEH